MKSREEGAKGGFSLIILFTSVGFPGGSEKHLPTMWETWVRTPGREDPLDKEMATHCSTLENAMDSGAWQATVHGITKSRT